jgi:hypothetical protein
MQVNLHLINDLYENVYILFPDETYKDMRAHTGLWIWKCMVYTATTDLEG